MNKINNLADDSKPVAVRTKWRTGHPPSPGWWPTLHQRETVYRWWDGTWWSYPAQPNDTPLRAAGWALLKSAFSPDVIRWTDRPADWPARSRT